MKVQKDTAAKNWFSGVYASVAILISVFGYGCVAYVYESFGIGLDHGHAGIAYFASSIINILIGIIGIIIGRILIGWKSYKL